VFGGMIAATALGVFAIPLLYIVFERARWWVMAQRGGADLAGLHRLAQKQRAPVVPSPPIAIAA
jgi:hypothetical protein